MTTWKQTWRRKAACHNNAIFFTSLLKLGMVADTNCEYQGTGKRSNWLLQIHNIMILENRIVEALLRTPLKLIGWKERRNERDISVLVWRSCQMGRSLKIDHAHLLFCISWVHPSTLFVRSCNNTIGQLRAQRWKRLITFSFKKSYLSQERFPLEHKYF